MLVLALDSLADSSCRLAVALRAPVALAALALGLCGALPDERAFATSREIGLYSFQGGSDGANPSMSYLIMDASGAFYGTTAGDFGGTSDGGTVFKLSLPGPGSTFWQETPIYRFQGTNGSDDGATPLAGLIADKSGAFYGTTSAGGSQDCSGSGCGTVFRLNPPTAKRSIWTETVLHSFHLNGVDGISPQARLAFDAKGALYGTTFAGGTGVNANCFNNCGTVSKLTPQGRALLWQETILYNFKGAADGANPESGVTFNMAGIMYGATANGGGSANCRAFGCGTIYRLVPSANGSSWHEDVIHAFQGGPLDGSNPITDLVVNVAGTLIGAARSGGANNCGSVFKLVPPPLDQHRGVETVLRFLDSAVDGCNPIGAVAFDKSGVLYMTTQSGGDLTCLAGNGCGTVFALRPPASKQSPAWTELVLHTFHGGIDGGEPQGSLLYDVARDGFYGLTLAGGDTNCAGFGCGVAYSVKWFPPPAR